MVHDIDRAVIYELARFPPFYAGTSRMARGRTLGSRQEHLEEKATPPVIHADSEADALLQIYNPLTDSLRLKADPDAFESLRGNYHYRREAGAYTIVLPRQ